MYRELAGVVMNTSADKDKFNLLMDASKKHLLKEIEYCEMIPEKNEELLKATRKVLNVIKPIR